MLYIIIALLVLPCLIVSLLLQWKQMTRYLISSMFVLPCLAGVLYLLFKTDVSWYIAMIPLSLIFIPLLIVFPYLSPDSSVSCREHPGDWIVYLMVMPGVIIIVGLMFSGILHAFHVREPFQIGFLSSVIFSTLYWIIGFTGDLYADVWQLNAWKRYGFTTPSLKCFLGFHQRLGCKCNRCERTFHRWEKLWQRKLSYYTEELVSYGYDNCYDTVKHQHWVSEYECIACKETKTESQPIS